MNKWKVVLSKKSIYFISVSILCVVAIAIVLFNIVFSLLGKQLDLGQKYMDEGDWMQAIVAFDEAINIDPKNEDAYIKKAEVYLNLNDMDNAVETLIEGYRVTSGKKIKKQINKISKEYDVIIDYKELDSIVNNNSNTTDSAQESSNKKPGNSNWFDKGDSDADIYGPVEDKVLRDKNIARAYSNYINGYISDDQVNALCDYWIPILEGERRNSETDRYSWGSSLSKLYYMSKDFDTCVEIIKEANISIEGENRTNASQDYYIADKFGNIVKQYKFMCTEAWTPCDQEETMSYRSDGKYSDVSIHRIYTEPASQVEDIVMVYEYDEQGRLISKIDSSRTTSEFMDETTESHTYNTYLYEGDTIEFKIKVEYSTGNGMATYESSQIMNMDAYGLVYESWDDGIVFD